MEKSIRIIYFGTPEFAAVPLKNLLKNGYNVVAVVTIPDKPQGRGQTLKSSEVAAVAEQYNIPTLKPKSLKSPKFLKSLQDLNPEVGVVVAFRKLPKVVWEMPTKGTFNLHASLLPQFRGAAPIHWAIIHGEPQTGVTSFFLNDEIDAGKIIMQESIDIMPDDTTGSMYHKLMHLGSDVIVQTIAAIAHDGVAAQDQPTDMPLKMAPKIFKTDALIDFRKSLPEIDQFIRGMNPIPGAYFEIEKEGKKVPLRINSAAIQFRDSHSISNQLIVEDKQLGVSHKEGVIWLKNIQAPGKRQLPADQFLNGWQDIENWHLVPKNKES
ncbi:MAG: methionyl-tRNA formyltransferase [Weeksellaceae bacterium]|nr:methionyl-tRNA formyltransferase [Weeksellaceae bacterium]